MGVLFPSLFAISKVLTCTLKTKHPPKITREGALGAPGSRAGTGEDLRDGDAGSDPP